MRGIEEERLKELYLSDKTSNSLQTAIQWLMVECKELNPWLPIDENTPKDKEMLFYWPPGATCNPLPVRMVGIFNKFFIKPTHYQELPPNPIAED